MNLCRREWSKVLLSANLIRLMPGPRWAHCMLLTCTVQQDISWRQTEWTWLFWGLRSCACVAYSNLAPTFSSKQQANQLSGWECKRLTLRATRATLTKLLNQCQTWNQWLWAAKIERKQTLCIGPGQCNHSDWAFAGTFQARRVKWHLWTLWLFCTMFPSTSAWAASTQ